jgi:V8-like Glu-specific endopeptidase
MKTFLFLALALTLFSTGCAKSTSSQAAPLRHEAYFKNPDQMSAVIVEASKAVFKITEYGGWGTAFFISSDGLFATNDHVLGRIGNNCAKEGCYVDAIFNLEKGKKTERFDDVFAEPVFNSSQSDIAVYQLWLVENLKKPDVRTKFKSPHFLTFSKENISQTLSQKQSLVAIGHPAGHLKKVAPLVVRNFYNEKLFFTGVAYKGMSGSPILSPSGEVVAIMHGKLDKNEDEVTPDISNFVMATPASYYFVEKNSGKKSSLLSLKSIYEVDTLWDVKTMFINGLQTLVDLKSGLQKNVMVELENSCHAELESHIKNISVVFPASVTKSLSRCKELIVWLNCSNPKSDITYQQCPNSNVYRKRVWEEIFSMGLKLSHEFRSEYDGDVFAWIYGNARLQTTDSDKQAQHAKNLEGYAEKFKPEINFEFISDWISAGKALTPAPLTNTDAVKAIKNFETNETYPYFLSDITSAIDGLYSQDLLTKEETRELYLKVARSPRASIRLILRIDMLLENL